MPLWTKVIVVALANLVGVYIVKYGEEKDAKRPALERLKRLSPNEHFDYVRNALADIPHSYIDINKYKIFNVYCATQAESAKSKKST